MDIQQYIQSGIIESYVMGLASDDEIIEVEKLALEQPEVQQAIDDYSELLEQQAFQNAVAPPPGVKERLMAAIREDDSAGSGAIAFSAHSSASVVTPAMLPEQEISSSSATIVPISTKQSSYKLWQYVAAASIILFVCSAAYNVYLYNEYSEKSQQYISLLNERTTLQASNNIYQTTIKQLQSANDMMADPAMAKVKMDGQKNKQDAALVLWDTRTKDVYLVANKLPSPAQGKQYQLWAIVDGKPVDAGMLDANCNSVCKMKNIPKAEAFAITLEKLGGNPGPTMTELYVMGKI